MKIDPFTDDLATQIAESLAKCGVSLDAVVGEHAVTSPVNGTTVASVGWSSAEDVHTAVERAREAFDKWRSVPAPRRGAIIKRFGDLLGQHKGTLPQSSERRSERSRQRR